MSPWRTLLLIASSSVALQEGRAVVGVGVREGEKVHPEVVLTGVQRRGVVHWKRGELK